MGSMNVRSRNVPAGALRFYSCARARGLPLRSEHVRCASALRSAAPRARDASAAHRRPTPGPFLAEAWRVARRIRQANAMATAGEAIDTQHDDPVLAGVGPHLERCVNATGRLR